MNISPGIIEVDLHGLNVEDALRKVNSAVNKADKLSIESRVENKITDEVVEPFYSTDKYDLFMVHPEEQLYVICSVIPRNYEHVLVDYDQLYDPFSKSKNKSKRKTL